MPYIFRPATYAQVLVVAKSAEETNQVDRQGPLCVGVHILMLVCPVFFFSVKTEDPTPWGPFSTQS